MKAYKNVDDYISAFPFATQTLLQQMRTTVLISTPQAVEGISYGMPAYKINGRPLVYFAAFEKHIGFYATPTGNREFTESLSKYKQGKGSVQFPINEKLPLALLSKMVKFRVKENMEKTGKSRP
jgi:uncharacterized protein YdhG (YjbR/CyaY superfamily)